LGLRAILTVIGANKRLYRAKLPFFIPRSAMIYLRKYSRSGQKTKYDYSLTPERQGKPD
jgi:hypothetical protein